MNDYETVIEYIMGDEGDYQSVLKALENMRRDGELIDALDRDVRANGPLLIHRGYPKGCSERGIGFMSERSSASIPATTRTLREALRSLIAASPAREAR